MGFVTAKDWRTAWPGAAGKWRDKAATRVALSEFDLLTGTEDDKARTLGRVVTASLHAMRYKDEQDPSVMYRKNLIAQRKSVSQLSAAARTLAKACERGDIAMKWALPGGKNDLRVTLDRPNDGRSVDVLEMGRNWFNELETNLKSKFSELHGGPFLKRYTAGNLHFEKAIAVGRKIDVSTMLAFELTFALRLFTAGRACDVTQSAQPMPTSGKPCAALVALFCNAALGTKLDGRQVADRLRKLPADVGLMGWPKAD